MKDTQKNFLLLKRLGIDTYKEAVIYIREDCDVCASEGFEAQRRIKVTHNNHSIIATLNTVKSDLLRRNEASLSVHAWNLLGAKEDEKVFLSHPRPLQSQFFIRSKIDGVQLTTSQITSIIEDVTGHLLSDMQIASFLVACAGGRMNNREIVDLTKAMVDVGETLTWDGDLIVDKHSVGGLPGNRTTPIIVSIVTAAGLIMPKTSSRAITSPAGTADTMEVLTNVDLSIEQMKKVVALEGGCIMWGGAVALSPADDILIRVEKAIDLDSEGQLVASVLSKKIAVGSTHVVIEIPMGATAKVKDSRMADLLKKYIEIVSAQLGLQTKVIQSDASQPVGRGIGPSLEARDVVQVLQCAEKAPQDLRERALILAGHILEFAPHIKEGEGKQKAQEILDSGKAWKKFQAICQAQGGLKEIPVAPHTHSCLASQAGTIVAIDNARLALVAKLAGAPRDKVAGVDLHVSLNDVVEKDQPLFTIHAQSPGELEYALNFLHEGNHVLTIEEG